MKLKCRHAAAYSAALDQLFTSASVEEGSTIATFLVCPKEIWSDFKNLTQITWVLEWSLTYSSVFFEEVNKTPLFERTSKDFQGASLS